MQVLDQIDPDEVSPVRRGAVGRRWVFAKSAGSELDPELLDVLEMPHDREGALVDALRKADVDEGAQKAAVAIVRLLKGFEGDLPVDLIAKATAKPAATDMGADENESTPGGDEDEEIPAGRGDVSKTAGDELGATTTEEQQMSETAAPAVPILKADGSWDLSGVPEESRGFYASVLKAADTARAENAVLVERVEKAEASAAEANATLREREFVAKADNEYGKIAPAAELGPVLKAAAESMDAEAFEKLEGFLKGANERVEKGDLFAEVGSKVLKGADARTAANVVDASSGDGWAKIEKMAEGLVEKSEGLTQEQAIERVLKSAAGREAYAEYMAEYYGGVA